MVRRRARNVLALIAAVTAAGLVAAGLALPAVLLAGATTTTVAESVRAVPEGLDPALPPQPSRIYAADGTTQLATFYDQYRVVVPLAKISPAMRQAIVAAEDRRFYQHGAVDAKGVLRAAAANLSGGGVSQGASTLTMQLVRNLLKNDQASTEAQRRAATDDTISRKLQEVRYAAELERTLTKDQILADYLNIAYFGAGAYGIEAAAQRYFSVPAAKLTVSQAALLAGLVQSPDAYNPISRDQKAAMARRAYVIASMRSMGSITAAEAKAAGAAPISLKLSAPPNSGCLGVATGRDDHGFFCDYFLRWWNAQPEFGKDAAAREQALKTGGYRIVTTLDTTVQATALEQSLSVYGYGDARALPIAAVQPGTGRVLAMAVNRHYGLTGSGGRPDPSVTVAPLISGGGGLTGYQAGSTFKMFTMLAALESGLPLDHSYYAQTRVVTKWRDTGSESCDGFYCPSNATPSWMNGQRTMWDGFGRSVNTYFVHLEEQVGADKAVAMAQKLGITFRAENDAALAEDAADWGAFTLGVSDTTPLDLANAYATLGADGVHCTPLPVVSVTDAAGRAVAGVADPSCKRVISAEVARAGADAARCPVGQQSTYGRCNGGTAPEVGAILGRPVAGKTGSSQGNVTETFVGVTPQVAAAGIAADPANPANAVGAAVSSRVDTAVARTMAAALVDQPVEDFPAPSRETAYGSDGGDDYGTNGDQGGNDSADESGTGSGNDSGNGGNGNGG